MPPSDYQRYNSNTFGIPKQGAIYKVMQDSGLQSEPHVDYIVQNVGKSDVIAEIRFGSKIMWYGIIRTAKVKPGKKIQLKVKNGGPYYVTGLIVHNNTEKRAVVHCALEGDIYPTYVTKEYDIFDDVKNTVIKQICELGVKNVPYDLPELLNLFWPEDAPNIWEDILDKVKTLVNTKALHIIRELHTGDVNNFKKRIAAFADEMNHGGKREDMRLLYMNIAKDLVGFEKRYIFGENITDHNNVNLFLLPCYSAFIMMKISFYAIGIRRYRLIRLTPEDMQNITYYSKKTIDGELAAVKHITDMYKQCLDYVYDTCHSEDLYDNIMNVRTLIATQGLEYIQIWNNMIKYPRDPERSYVDVISYSTFYGRQTANMINQALPYAMSEPLTPKLIDGTRNKIESIDIYQWRLSEEEEDSPKIGGMRVHFENKGEIDEKEYGSYKMGTRTDDIINIDFKEALLNKLEVYGDGALDCLVFHLSDGRTETCGTVRDSDRHHNRIFELKDHHIVSLYLAADNPSLHGQAANISVAYQLKYDVLI